jgi:predicted enzyme related to lactoylglutathione lyase
MTRTLIRAAYTAMLAAFLVSAAHSQQTSASAQGENPVTTATPIVFFDIAGPDGAAQKEFYSKVFNWEIGGPMNNLSVPVNASKTGFMGTLRTEPKEVMLYMGVEDIPGTLAKVEKHGGKIVAPRFEVPGGVTLGLFTDPAGNRMGLVEMEGDMAKVP